MTPPRRVSQGIEEQQRVRGLDPAPDRAFLRRERRRVAGLPGSGGVLRRTWSSLVTFLVQDQMSRVMFSTTRVPR